MTSGAPWSVKGIDPKAREIAKDLARRSGMTLGEWLNQMIFEDGSEAAESDAGESSGQRATRRGDDPSQVLAALEELSARLESSEAKQAQTAALFETAFKALRADQAKVAERLQAAEAKGGGAQSRPETLRALEGALGHIAKHLKDGEARTREALGAMRREMSQEIQQVADQMGRKAQEVENRGADAISQVGAEVTRVASVVEQRLRRADDAQAEALEKLGAEIARITERLSERIAAAERRSAQAIDDVGEQMARVTDRIHQRQERSATELSDRMRQSEERTVKLLEEAREKIERRLARRDGGGEVVAEEASAFAARWSAVDVAPTQALESAAPAIFAPEFMPEQAVEPTFVEPPPLMVEADSIPEFEPEPEFPETIPDVPAPTQVLPPPPQSEFTPYLVESEDEPEPAPPVALEALAPAEPIEFPEETEALRPSTRELIAAARAAARGEVEEEPPFQTSDLMEEPEPEIVLSRGRRRKPRMSIAKRLGLLMGGAASIGLAGAGYAVMHPEVMTSLTGVATPTKTAEVAKPIPVGPPSAPAAPQQSLTLTAPPAGGAATDDDEHSDAGALYRDAAARVDAGDASGVAPLRTAANLGFAPAQRRLGKLYEDGGAGIQKDPVEGRRWTQRAAANGDAHGMHNLALDYYEGIGGVKNPVVAKEWFQRAAELGLRDSQYNLARFYESGLGVKQDLGQAYRWYQIAARAGDTEAAARGEALKTQLTPEILASMDKAAATFSPAPAAPPASLTTGLKSASPQQLALAQRALGKLGYYQGAADGAPSQTLGEAIQAYQRDRGLAANGTLSPELVQTFSNVSR